MPEWSKGYDLRSYGESLVGSNPTATIDIFFYICMVACPSGLRGTTQDRMAKASWVRTPLLPYIY